jgi:IS605 OrfB family transposase
MRGTKTSGDEMRTPGKLSTQPTTKPRKHKNKNQIFLSYPIEIPSWMKNLAKNLETLNTTLINQALPKFWNEETIDGIHAYGLNTNGEHTLPAYKYFEQVLRIVNPWEKALPSRYRRALLEQIGMILRSQKPRKDTYHLIKQIFQECYKKDEKNERRRKRLTYKNIAKKLFTAGYKVDSTLLKQVVYQTCNYYEEHRELPEKYTDLVTPRVESGSLTLMPDDGQMFRLKMRVRGKRLKLTVEVKLPLSKDGRKWKWFTFSIEPYEQLKKILAQAHEVHNPVFVPRVRKSGVKDYELVLPLSLKNKKRRVSGRILSVDLGERKLATLVVIDERYRQLAPPIFIKPRTWSKMKAIRFEMDRLKSKIDRGLDYDGRLNAQFIRLQKKLNRMRDVVVDELSSIIVKAALIYGCDTIVVEDLRSYQPDGRKGLLNWLLSNWRRGDILFHVEYIAALHGIRVVRVPPNDTSRRCPRCGAYGVHVKSPRHPIVGGEYAFFKCLVCGFMGDRDYVGALNVGRCFLAGGWWDSLGRANPLIYMVGGSPLGDCSPGGPSNTESVPRSCFTQVSVSVRGSVAVLLRSMSLRDEYEHLRKKEQFIGKFFF